MPRVKLNGSSESVTLGKCNWWSKKLDEKKFIDAPTQNWKRDETLIGHLGGNKVQKDYPLMARVNAGGCR